jgi:hypothetical protein
MCRVIAVIGQTVGLDCRRRFFVGVVMTSAAMAGSNFMPVMQINPDMRLNDRGRQKLVCGVGMMGAAADQRVPKHADDR